MKLWMDVMRDLEHVLEDHEALFDAWAAGGVDGLVIGPLVFNSPKLLPGVVSQPAAGPPTLTFDPEPAIYRRLGVQPPTAPQALPERRRQLEQALQAAKDRGFQVWIFQAQTGAGPGGSGHHLFDERSRAAVAARMADTLAHYPMADGAIMDGPEWGYEMSPHHMHRRSYLFDDLPESVAAGCASLGYDYRALTGARDRLLERLHALDPGAVRLHAGGGLLGAFHLLGADPDLMGWLAFRVASLTAYFAGIRELLDAASDRPVRLGVGPRTAAFAPLCGYDFSRLGRAVDVLLPKHYFWHRGFDGLLGTVYRYVETLCDWNPGLSDADALAVVGALFGLSLPDVAQRTDLESALTPEFFQTVAAAETRRALAAVDDAERIVPWVDAGRAPHDGDPMSAGDLKSLLETASAAGLQRFLYHHHGNLTAGEWAVISGLCGQQWDPRRSAYRPPDELVL